MKTKLKRATPPIIVLIDVLMQFMFVAMAQVSPGIEIKIPKHILFPGEYVVANIQGQMQYFNGNRFIPFDKSLGITFYLKHDCVGTLCDEALNVLPSHIDPSIAITGKLFTNLSTLTFLACNTSAAQCSNIQYNILENGTIDKIALLQDNPIFKKIPGIGASN